MRYRFRTLLIVLALGPPVLAGVVWLISMVAQIASETVTSESPSPYHFAVISGGGIEPATNVELRSAVRAAHQRAKKDSDGFIQ